MRVKLDEKAFMPTRAHETDAGLDLYSPCDAVVPANGSVCIDTGVHIELQTAFIGLWIFNTVGMIKSKSGLMLKGIKSEGTIDVGYTGSIGIKLFNHSNEHYKVRKGDKISQLVIMPIFTPALELVDELEETERGNGGFGSTGR
jgi:dUTP pyrophosphatase